MNAEYELLLKQYDLPQLQSLLAEIESRLGTPAEQPVDLECAQAVGHQLRNLLAGARLMHELARHPQPARSL